MLQKIHGFMLKCTSGFTANRLETFILFCSSLLPDRFGMVPYFLVALVVAELVLE